MQGKFVNIKIFSRKKKKNVKYPLNFECIYI